MRVLVIEDDRVTLATCVAMIESMGHVAVACETGAAALAAVVKDDFEIALCDVQLPDIDGVFVIRALRAQLPSLCVIAVTAIDDASHGFAHLHASLHEAGATVLLKKPLRMHRLHKELELVEASRAQVDVYLQLADPLERSRVTRALTLAGCRVIDARRVPFEATTARLALLDAVGDAQEPMPQDAHTLLRQCTDAGVVALVVAPQADSDDGWLRRGASMTLRAPLDVESIVAQARFIAR
jgi:DNA-binding response OmpR family regulator